MVGSRPVGIYYVVTAYICLEGFRHGFQLGIILEGALHYTAYAVDRR
jgi:hypothetical protein